MNQSEVPLNSIVSPYRRLARRVGLCRQKCSECDCSGHVAVAIAHSQYTVQELLALPEVSSEIQQLIRGFRQESGDIVSEPNISEHVNITRMPQLPLKIDYPDEDL